MNNVQLTSEHRKESISFACVVVGAVFFLVLSQALILRLPELVTQIFRPIIVFFLIIQMVQRGRINFSARNIALAAAIYCAFDLFITGINMDELIRASAVSLYMLMFWAVTGTPWNKREVRFIIGACFIGAFACAVALLLSNDPTDLHVGSNSNMKMFGMYVNRNKNAYAFAIGTIIGSIYLLYGRNIKKFWIAILTAVIAYALLYSQCRGAFFCTVLGVTIAVMGRLLKIKKYSGGKFVFYLLLYAAFCVAVYFLLKNSELSRLIDGDSKSGRDEGIKYAWNLFLDYDSFSKIFGKGHLYESLHTEGVGAHLLYINFLLSTGIIGCTLVVLTIVRAGIRIKGAAPYALFICALSRTFFEGLDYYIYIPLILSVIIDNYSIRCKRNERGLFDGN